MGRPGGNRRNRGGGRALTWRYEVWSLQHFEIKILSEKIFKALYVRDNFTIFLIVCIGCTWAVWVDARTSRDQEHQSHQSWIVIGPTVTSSQLYHSITASFDEHWASSHPPPPVLQPPVLQLVLLGGVRNHAAAAGPLLPPIVLYIKKYFYNTADDDRAIEFLCYLLYVKNTNISSGFLASIVL